ncbi:MAG: tripartite tricarboxylate transporter TctB family protein [Serpentinimonas sp.]|nr:MAG: hypothetical protein JM57_10335 [Comamonadaceae bacterium BICA1-1]MDO8274146.1 tripartite tricarboxylate transporter TctB family protein [Serpentinimonas sp.]MDO9610245.1 tripartite tricarboxylate transporter TctB family protein [Serpentinimonas sp.]
MLNKDLQDLIGGLAMLAIGTFAALYAWQNLDIGALSRMGPGFFPLVLGSMLAVLGLLIALPALFRPGSGPLGIDFKALFFVTLALLLFAFLLRPLGVLLTSMVMVLVSTLPLSLSTVGWKTRILTALGVAAVTWVVFILGLGMNLPTWPWSH